MIDVKESYTCSKFVDMNIIWDTHVEQFVKYLKRGITMYKLLYIHTL